MKNFVNAVCVIIALAMVPVLATTEDLKIQIVAWVIVSLSGACVSQTDVFDAVEDNEFERDNPGNN